MKACCIRNCRDQRCLNTGNVESQRWRDLLGLFKQCLVWLALQHCSITSFILPVFGILDKPSCIIQECHQDWFEDIGIILTFGSTHPWSAARWHKSSKPASKSSGGEFMLSHIHHSWRWFQPVVGDITTSERLYSFSEAHGLLVIAFTKLVCYAPQLQRKLWQENHAIRYLFPPTTASTSLNWRFGNSNSSHNLAFNCYLFWQAFLLSKQKDARHSL